MKKITKGSAEKFAKRLGDALFELENMQIAYEADRLLQISIIEKYKDEKGTRFTKAQKAAVRGDEDAARIREIEKRKKKLLENLSKVWSVYTGNDIAGEIIAEYIKKNGDYEKLKSKYTTEQIEEAINLWKKYSKMTNALYAQRELEKQKKIRDVKKEARHMQYKERMKVYAELRKKGLL